MLSLATLSALIGAFVLSLALPLLWFQAHLKTKDKRGVIVLVLGDIGHSPRMVNHAQELSKLGLRVHLLGYRDSSAGKLEQDQNVTIYSLRRRRTLKDDGVGLVTKAIGQALDLVWVLFFRCPRVKFVLVQNPPSIPTLPICWLYGLICRTDIIVDWHNLGWTLLGLKIGESNWMVKFMRTLEAGFGRRATRHFVVSKAMGRFLENQLSISNERIQVLYDRPRESFAHIAADEHATIRAMLAHQYPALQPLVREPPKLTLISSTSWTADEDFDLVLSAFKLDRSLSSSWSLIVTGKGPMKGQYVDKFKAAGVDMVTVWTEPEDYRLLLAVSDVGLCLHTSSSKLDLPMKVVDMLGAGVPVIALDYPCLDELLTPGRSGWIFATPQDLCNILKRLSEHRDEIGQYAAAVRDNPLGGWSGHWQKHAVPFLPS